MALAELENNKQAEQALPAAQAGGEIISEVTEVDDDGSMSLVIRYALSGDSFFEICRNCTYTVDKNEINITWITNDPVVHHTEYSIKDGMLEIDGAYFYRAGNNPATPDQVKK